MSTKIEWATDTWNPVVGCTRASRGCDSCYAVTMSKRLAAMGQTNYEGLVGNGHFNGTVRCLPERLDVPLRWKKPRKVFVNSMSDLFHRDVSIYFIARVFAVMANARQHTFQVLTKRPDRMAEVLRDEKFWRLVRITACRGIAGRQFGVPHATLERPLANVWLGTSVEDQDAADERIPHLLQTPAAVRFLSCEPLLGKIDLTRPVGGSILDYDGCATSLWPLPMPIHWVIAGAESGHGARPAQMEWYRSLRDQCQAAGGVPFFLKQHAENGRKIPLPELDGRTWDLFPEAVPA